MATKMTQADRDAGLTQADVDAGMRGGRNERILDADREVALANAGKNPDSIVDQYNTKPAAKAFPVDMGGSKPAPRSAPQPVAKAAPKPVAKAAPKPAPKAAPKPDPMPESMPNEIPSGYTPAAPKKAAPSRGSYDRPGPFGDFINMMKGKPGGPKLYRGKPKGEVDAEGYKKGGSVKSSASKRGDGCAIRGKTKGKIL